METLQFAVPALDIKAIIPQVILACTALVVLLIDVFMREKPRSYLSTLAAAGSACAAASVALSAGLNRSAYSGMLIVDGFSGFITVTVCVVAFLTILVSNNYQEFFTNINCGEYYCLVLLATVGMSLMGASGNLIMIFLALETMSIAVYALAAFHKEDLRSIESAMKYLLLGAFASAFLLYGCALLYGATGTMDIVEIGRFLKANPDVLHSRLVMSGVALLTVGFGFKIAMVPFHMWTPDVYEGAPTSVTAFMATGVKAAAFAAFIRVFFTALAPLQIDWTPLMWLAALVTMTVGNLAAIVQTNIKRMLAYSSIAHAGYLLVGFVAGGGLAVAGMLYYLLAYAFMNIGAFGVIALLGKRGKEYTAIADFSALGLRYPVMGLLMAAFMFSMAGIPPTAGFMGKFYIFAAAIKSGFVWLAVFGVVNSVISIYYYLRIVVVMYFSEAEETVSVQPPGLSIVLALAIAAAGVLLMGIVPAYFWELAVQSSGMYM